MKTYSLMKEIDFCCINRPDRKFKIYNQRRDPLDWSKITCYYSNNPKYHEIFFFISKFS